MEAVSNAGGKDPMIIASKASWVSRSSGENFKYNLSEQFVLGGDDPYMSAQCRPVLDVCHLEEGEVLVATTLGSEYNTISLLQLSRKGDQPAELLFEISFKVQVTALQLKKGIADIKERRSDGLSSRIELIVGCSDGTVFCVMQMRDSEASSVPLSGGECFNIYAERPKRKYGDWVPLNDDSLSRDFNRWKVCVLLSSITDGEFADKFNTRLFLKSASSNNEGDTTASTPSSSPSSIRSQHNGKSKFRMKSLFKKGEEVTFLGAIELPVDTHRKGTRSFVDPSAVYLHGKTLAAATEVNNCTKTPFTRVYHISVGYNRWVHHGQPFEAPSSLNSGVTYNLSKGGISAFSMNAAADTLFVACSEGVVMEFDKKLGSNDLSHLSALEKQASSMKGKQSKRVHNGAHGSVTNIDGDEEELDERSPLKRHKNPIAYLSLSTGVDSSTGVSFLPSLIDLKFAPNGCYWAVILVGGVVRVYDCKDGALVCLVSTFFGEALCLAWTPDSKALLIGGVDDGVTVVDVNNGKIIAKCEGHDSWIRGLTVFHNWTDGDVVAGHSCASEWAPEEDEGCVVIGPTSTLSSTYNYAGQGNYAFCSFSEDGKYSFWEVPKVEGETERPTELLNGALSNATSTGVTKNIEQSARFHITARDYVGAKVYRPIITEKLCSEAISTVAHLDISQQIEMNGMTRRTDVSNAGIIAVLTRTRRLIIYRRQL